MKSGAEKIRVLDVQVNATTIDLAAEMIFGWIKERHKTYVCIAPVSTVVDCQSDPQYLKIVNGAGMVTPDGMPLVWLGRLQGNKVIQRTYGPDLMLKLCGSGQSAGIKHYFYGGTPDVCRKLEERLKGKFPALKVSGKFSPPFTPQAEMESPRVIDDINRAAPDILWVGLGSPKQDFWIYKHRDKLEVPVIIGIGAAFDFLSGAKKQAPRWMQKAGLEWLFRLLCEPRRLWKRYLVGNSKFIFYLLRDLVPRKAVKAT